MFESRLALLVCALEPCYEDIDGSSILRPLILLSLFQGLLVQPNPAPNPEKNAQVLRVILIEGTGNLLVLATKLAVGLSTGSLAILGDALHSVTDVLNNGLAWMVMRQANEPPDSKHPYGHRKFETLAVFVLASLLAAVGFELVIRALSRDNTVIVSSDWGLALMLGVLVVNISLATWQRRWARRLDSEILYADASHTFADVLTTIVVIVGWQLSAMGYVWLDQLCAIGVAGLVFYLAYGLFRKAIPVLVDESAIESSLLIAAAEEITGAGSVRQVRSRWKGSDSAVDMVVSANAHLTLREAHAIADDIEKVLEERFGLKDVSIHMEPDQT